MAIPFLQNYLEEECTMDEQNWQPGTDPDRQTSNPFDQITVDSIGQMSEEPLTQQSANPYGQQSANPYGQQSANPYGQQSANPYGQQLANPYSQQSANPYGQQSANPYGQRPVNPYGQQPANPYGQQPANPYGQQPANPYAPQTSMNPYGMGGAPVPPKPPKKKMSGKMKALIFGGIGLVALGIGLYFLFTMVIFPPKKTVKAAMESTFSGEEGNKISSPVLNELGGKEMMDSFKGKGGSIELQVSGKSGALKNLQLDLNVAKDDTKKLLSAQGTISGNGESITGELFADEEHTYGTVKDLIDGYLSINNKNVISSLLKAPILQGTDVSSLGAIPDISLNYFGSGESGTNPLLNEDFWDSVSVSSDGKDKLQIGTSSVNVDKYKVTIPKEKIDEWIDKTVDQLLDNMDNSAIGQILQQQGGALGNLSQMKDQIKPMLKSIFKEDYPFWIYVDDGRVVGARFAGTLSITAYNFEYELNIMAYGSDEKALYGVTGSISIMGQKIGITATIASNNEGSTVKTDAVLSLERGNSKMIDGTYSQTYDSGSKAISGSGSLKVNGEEVGSVNVSGSVTESTPGKSFSVSLDDITLTAKSKSVSLSAKLTAKTLDGGATVAERDSGKKVLDLTTCTKEDLNAMSNEDAMRQIEKKLEKIFELH